MQYWVHVTANMYPKRCFWILNYFLRLDNIRGPAYRKLEFQSPLTTLGTPLTPLRGGTVPRALRAFLEVSGGAEGFRRFHCANARSKDFLKNKKSRIWVEEAQGRLLVLKGGWGGRAAFGVERGLERRCGFWCYCLGKFTKSMKHLRNSRKSSTFADSWGENVVF